MFDPRTADIVALPQTNLHLLEPVELNSEFELMEADTDIGDMLGTILAFLMFFHQKGAIEFVKQVPDSLSINEFVHDRPGDAVWFLDHVAHEIMHAICPEGYRYGKNDNTGEIGFWKTTPYSDSEDLSTVAVTNHAS